MINIIKTQVPNKSSKFKLYLEFEFGTLKLLFKENLLFLVRNIVPEPEPKPVKKIPGTGAGQKRTGSAILSVPHIM